MTNQPSPSCEQVEAALLAGPTEANPDQARAVAEHLATCASCRASDRMLDRDRAAIREYLGGAAWLPVASRVFAALPEVRNTQPGRRAPAHREPGREKVITGLGSRRSRPAPSRIMATVQAACVLVIGLGLGLSLHTLWPTGNGDTDPGSSQLAAPSSGTGYAGAPDMTGRTGGAGSSAYAPAPANNPPLAVPNTTGSIATTQNRETWRVVRGDVASGFAPLLYPPVPPSTFDSIVVSDASPDTFSVRYGGTDMTLTLSAGQAARDAQLTGSPAAITVHGQPGRATVSTTTVPGQGGLTLDGTTSGALAPGTVIEVSWSEPGLWQDTTTGTSASSVPYRVSAAGLPLAVVTTFIDSLAAFGNGWDELRQSLPASTVLVMPATMPEGFGSATLSGQRTVAAAQGLVSTWAVTYQHPGATGADQITFSSGPVSPASGTSRPVSVLGASGTMTTVPAPSGASSGAIARTFVDWTVNGTPFRITFDGNGITAADITTVLGGLRIGTVASSAPPSPAVTATPPAALRSVHEGRGEPERLAA